MRLPQVKSRRGCHAERRPSGSHPCPGERVRPIVKEQSRKLDVVPVRAPVEGRPTVLQTRCESSDVRLHPRACIFGP